MTNPNTAPSADSDGGAELPQVDANNSGLAMKLADGREVRARLSVDGGSVCFDLTATNAAHTKIALSFEAIESMRLLANRLAAAQECGEAVAPEAKPDDKPMLIMTGAQLRAALDFVNPDAGDADQLETEVCIQWGAERTDEDGGTEPAGLRAWLADYPDEGSISLDLWGTEEPTAPPAPLPGKRERALFQAWARDRHWNLSLRADGERYMSESTQEGWYAWKGRAALSSPPTLEAAPADYPPPDAALAEFTDYFVRNYPGPDTIITDPKWHAPKLFRAAQRAISRAGLRSGVSADPLPRPLLTDLEIQGLRRQARNDPRCADQHWFILMVRAIESYYGVTGAAAQSLPLVEPTADRKSLNAMAADLLRPYLKEGQKVIWREAFRWQDDNGVLSNHYDGMELEQLADDFGYDWRYDMNFKHAAIVWNKVAASPQHQVKKGELS